MADAGGGGSAGGGDPSPTPPSLSLPEFLERTRTLLALEHSAEKAEAARVLEGVSHRERERRGVAICRLKHTDTKTSLNGRTVLRFASSRKAEPADGKASGGGGEGDRESRGDAVARLPATKLRPGDVVGVSVIIGGVERQLLEGVLLQMHQEWLSVAVDEPPDEGLSGGGLVVTRRANEVTHKRLLATLDELSHCVTSSGGLDGSQVVRSLFGETPPGARLGRSGNAGRVEGDGGGGEGEAMVGLNASQSRAVTYCLENPVVSVIHGPPGTGKTTTVVELIRQLTKRGQKVLAAAPSNIAVDNLAERLLRAGVKVVRIGHPARIMEAAQAISLDALVDASDEAALVRDVRKEMNAITKKLSGKGGRHAQGAEGKRQLRTEFRTLRKELRQRESASIREVLKGVEVVIGTLTGLVKSGPIGLLPREHFDVAIVDEAGQALEAACWTVLLRAQRCVLAGDHLQLPPTITSPDASKGGLQVTLLERAVHVIGEDAVCLLDTQYRMHEDIMRWSSDLLYGGRLIAADSVKARLLHHLPHVEQDDNTEVPLVYVDTVGCGFDESVAKEDEDASVSNEGEATIIEHQVRALLGAGLTQDDIGIITPYNGQVDLLRSKLSDEFPAIEIRSIDGFQGREKEAILISLVRSNDRRTVGFLSECRRLNVAVTRAKRHLFLVGDSDTISSDRRLATLIDYLGDTADVRSGFEFVSSVDGNVSMRPASKPKPKRVEKPRETELERRARFAALFDGFLADPRFESHRFPSTLNSFERMLVHELAEQHGLGHASHGEDTDRRIRVWRITPAAPAPEEKKKSGAEASVAAVPGGEVHLPTDAAEAAAPPPDVPASTTPAAEPADAGASGGVSADVAESTDSATAPEAPLPTQADPNEPAEDHPHEEVSTPPTVAAAETTEAVEVAPPSVVCSICGTSIPEANFDVHEVRCERQKRLNSKAEKSRAAAAAAVASAFAAARSARRRALSEMGFSLGTSATVGVGAAFGVSTILAGLASLGMERIDSAALGSTCIGASSSSDDEPDESESDDESEDSGCGVGTLRLGCLAAFGSFTFFSFGAFSDFAFLAGDSLASAGRFPAGDAATADPAGVAAAEVPWLNLHLFPRVHVPSR
eukprot:m.271702 g.271702  ORF g.271702 m.271702 type:complete len:1117 (-) comp16102_c1_seq1:568-3918(-)